MLKKAKDLEVNDFIYHQKVYKEVTGIRYYDQHTPRVQIFFISGSTHSIETRVYTVLGRHMKVLPLGNVYYESMIWPYRMGSYICPKCDIITPIFMRCLHK